MPDDQVTQDLKALTEIERRTKYLRIRNMENKFPLKKLIASCLKNVPDQRPEIDEVMQIFVRQLDTILF